MKRIAVIGGGASGLIAACYAAGKNREVVLFEKQKKLGRKILATGNGRCNITNKNLSVLNYHGRNPEFVHNIFARFGLDETVDFFRSIGIPFVEGENGRLYPFSLQASTIPNLFEYELKKRNIEIRLHRKIVRIVQEKGRFLIITAGMEKHRFDSVILSTGGCAYPQLGGSGIGYELAGSLGHNIYPLFPSILPINIPLKIIHRLQGIKWESSIKVELNGRVLSDSTGELLFTGYGISGPAALDISRTVNENIINGETPKIIIDFYPGISEAELLDKLKLLWADAGKDVSFSLLGIMKQRMNQVLLDLAGIENIKKVRNLTDKEKNRIVKTLKSLTLIPGKPRFFNEAVVTAGGLDVDEINPKNMESGLVKNFFITGELLDIDGDSGGYNLQFAWSTGAIAGMSQ